jgi:hypothetical protein
MPRIGVGLGLGLYQSRGIFASYASRVLADGGITEAGDCVDAVSGLRLDASLLLIPSGYKGGKAYAEIPTNGNGDLTWTRASDAWRTNADGLIQRVSWNLLQQSETFDNAVWVKDASTISSNAINAPNGTLTADLLIPSTTSANDHRIRQYLPTSVGNFNYSVYVKSGGYNWVKLRSEANWANVNLSNGAIGFTSGVTPTVEILSNGWYRISFSVVNVSGGFAYVYPMNVNENIIDPSAWAGNGTSGVYIWGAQLVEGSSAQTYFPTTDRLNVPRLSYMYGSCPALLLEPQRTNLALRSEEFDNAYWSKYLATVSANTATSPDGTQNADLVYPSSTGSLAGQLFRQISSGISSGNVVTISAYVKASGKNFAYLSQIQNSFSPDAYFNLTTGAITNISSGVTASMTQLTNSWWRISITSTAGVGLYYAVIGSTDSAGSTTNTASGTNGILVYGYQVEVGAYPTTYIPTTTASATRVADSFSRNNIYTNGLITSSGGTWFVELRNNVSYTGDAGGDAIILGDTQNTAGNNFRLFSGTSSGRIIIFKTISATPTSLYTTTTDTTKIAIKWNGSTADVFANGTKVVSATAFTATQLEFFWTNIVAVPKFIQAMALYPTPLSDAQCQTLTTL